MAVISVHASPLGRLGEGENGGMNLAIRRLCEGLAAHGVPTDVFVRRDRPDAPDEQLIAPRSRLVRLAAGPAEPLDKREVLRHLPGFTGALLDHAASERRSYRALHAHYWLSGWVASRVAQRWSVPWVQSFHTLARVKQAAGLAGEGEREHVEEMLVRSADRHVAMSAAEERALVELYGADPDRICVIPPGVDLDEYRPRPSAAVREQLGLRDRRVVLYAGRLEPLKGADLLVDAMARVAEDSALADVVTLIAGADSGDGRAQSGHPGGEAGRLEALARRRGIGDRVRFIGPVPHAELARLYALADVCVVPSHTETFGLVALEAQASGTPVVATRVGGLVDIVEDGVTGYLVADRDPLAVAGRIGALLADAGLREAMGEAARWRAARFTWVRSVERLVALYDCVESPQETALETCGCL